MKNIILMLTLLSLFSCAQTTKHRSPSNFDGEIVKAEEKIDKLLEIKNSSESMAYMEFTDSGLESKGKYILKGNVFSNNINGISSIAVFIRSSNVRKLDFDKQEDKILINTVVPFKLPLESTHIRFTFEDETYNEVELVCTRPSKC